jgi:hypothetical protein
VAGQEVEYEVAGQSTAVCRRVMHRDDTLGVAREYLVVVVSTLAVSVVAVSVGSVGMLVALSFPAPRG